MCLRRLLRNPSRPGRVWLLTALVSLLGCGDAGSVRLDGVAEVEPTVADAPDSSAAKMFRELESTSQSVGPNASWPQLFGPDRTSAVDAEIDPLWDADGPEALWSIEIGTGYGSPVVDQEKVVFNHRIGNEEIVQCVDASTGQTIWEHRYPTSFETEYEYSNGPYSTPVLANQRVYAVGGQGQFFCLDLNSGQPVWSRDLHGEYGMQDDIFAVGSTPLLVGDRLIFNLGAGDNNSRLIALAAKRCGKRRITEPDIAVRFRRRFMINRLCLL
jgi:outer membrane protein assembly factor BamB